MPTITCRNYDNVFNTDRDSATEGADTRRCPGYGYKHGEEELDARTVEPATDGGTAGNAVEITLRVTGVDDASDIAFEIDE